MNKSISRFSMICFLAMALCFIVGCQNQAGKAELEEMKAHEATEAEIAMMSSEEREAWQKQYDQAQTAIDLAEKELA